VGIDLDKEAPNVVLPPEFTRLINEGFHAEIVCRADASNRNSIWYGDWIIRVVSADGKFERTLVPERTRNRRAEASRYREFKTANGLVSFMHKHGFKEVTVPLYQGMRASHVLLGVAKNPDQEASSE